MWIEKIAARLCFAHGDVAPRSALSDGIRRSQIGLNENASHEARDLLILLSAKVRHFGT